MVHMFSEQLDLVDAIRRREQGMAEVEAHSDSEYRYRLIGAIEVLAASAREFTADEARKIAGDPPPTTHPNIAGALFNAAAKAGTIRMVGYGLSTRPQGHGNLVRRWIGVKP